MAVIESVALISLEEGRGREEQLTTPAAEETSMDNPKRPEIPLYEIHVPNTDQNDHDRSQLEIKATREEIEDEVNLQELSEESRRAAVNEKDSEGYAALHRAVKEGDIKEMERLILIGADVDLMTDINTKDEQRCTALHLAAIQGNLAAVRLLLDPKKYLSIQSTTEGCDSPLKPANPNLVGWRYGETPLHCACEYGHVEVVSTLLEHGADVKIGLDFLQRTPLITALEQQNCNVKIVNLLLQHEADVNTRDHKGRTPLNWALMKGCSVKVITTLLRHGANVHTAKSTDRYAPIHAASQSGDVELVSFLLERGVDVNSSANYGAPLHYACRRGHAEVVSTLLKNKADVELLYDDQTALHIASDGGHEDVVEVLLAHGADVTKKDEKGFTALMLAIREGHKNVVKKFIKSNQWEAAFKLTDELENTPLRETIRKMPDVAVMVLDRCTTPYIRKSEVDPNCEECSVDFSYELIDDFRDPGDKHDDDFRDPDMHDDNQINESCGSKLNRWIFPADGGFSTKWGPRGFDQYNHPLNLMAQSENQKLLTHPLVTDLLRKKWKVTQVIYFLNLLFYCIFLAFLTGFALTAPNPLSETCQAVFNGNSSVGNMCEQSGSRRQSVFAAAIFTIVFAIFRLVIEVYQMYKHRQSYFADWVNWLEVFTVVFAIIFAWVFNTGCLCVHPWQWQIGTLAVFLAWTDFIIFVQKLPVIGIYVVMLTDILWIFIKTVPLTIMLVIAFALGLFMTFHEPGVLRSPFSTPARSLLSITTYSTGGFDFDGIFRQAPGGTVNDNDVEEIPFPPVSYILWIIFIIIMPILLNNLLTGLAVGDIDETLKKAEGKKVALEIELILSVQATLSEKLRRKFIIGDRREYPDKDLLLKQKVAKFVLGPSRFPSWREIKESINQGEDDQTYSLLNKMKTTMAKETQEMKQKMNDMTNETLDMKQKMNDMTSETQDMKQKMNDMLNLLQNLAKAIEK